MAESGVADTLSVSALIDDGKVSFQQVLVVGLCLIFNMLDGFDITAMAVTANAVGLELQLAEDKLGFVFSFSLAGMMLGAMFLASLSDVFGRRTVIIASLLVVGGSVLLTGYSNSLSALIALRFISGLGAGALLASQATLAAEYSPEKYRALSVAIVTAGYPLGAMMTGLLAGVIVPEFGWRGMFIGGGYVTLVMAGLAYALLPESLHFLCSKQPPDALAKVNRILKKFSVASVDQLPPAVTTVTAAGAPTPGVSGAEAPQSESFIAKMLKLLAPEHRRSTLMLWSAFLMSLCTLYFLMSWVPKMMINAGFSTEVANYAFTLFNFGGVTGIFLLGGLATRLGLSNLICSFLLIGAAGMLLFAAVDAEQNMLLALIFLIGVALQGGFTGMYAAAAKIYPTEIRSTGVGWAIGLGRFGAVVGPAAAGFMIAAGIPMATNFIIFAVPLIISGLLAVWLRLR